MKISHSPKPTKVVAVALSEKKGEQKTPVPCVSLVRNFGIMRDAHAGDPLRQVSLLSLESIKIMEKLFGSPLPFGSFAENVVVDGALKGLVPKDLIGLGKDAVLEVTAIGKECHKGCAIRAKTGDCIMPREGVFARVAASGEVLPGEKVKVLQRQDVSVIVLAGGKSRRFGSDKRFAKLQDGRTWLERAIDLGLEVSNNVIVSVGAEEPAKVLRGVRLVPDIVPDRGPLGGLVTCLSLCKTKTILAFAVDQVNLIGDILRVLAVRLDGVGVCFEHNGRIEPFPCALDRRKALQGLKWALKNKIFSVREAMGNIEVTALSANTVKEMGEPSYLLWNCNTQEDVTRIQHHGGIL